MVYILYNPTANCSKSRACVNDCVRLYSSQKVETKNVMDISDYKDFFSSIDDSDDVVLIGGDGTINVLCNQMKGIKIKNRLFIYKAGTGNDFLRDIFSEEPKDGTVVQLNEYIENLPVVTVNGKDILFLNNVGYGIDGAVCTKGDELRAQGKTDINYASLAIKLMLTEYKTADAKITVDGTTRKYKKVWLSPVMNGRFYGGGMNIAPSQDRKGSTVSCTVFYGSNRLQTLMIFPTIFKGEHIKYKKHIDILSGHEIEIELSRPQDVQIDGEVIRDVTKLSVSKYSAFAERECEGKQSATV